MHVVVPEGVDDPRHPSGGNVYDRHLCRELTTLGWTVHEHVVAPPHLARALASVPDRGVVLLDGLIASEALIAETSRLRIVVLLHMPVGDDHERAVLSAAAAVVTTSRWARRSVIDQHGVPEQRVSVAAPGADVSAPTPPPPSEALLCVAAVVPAKGHDVLLDALSRIAHLAWRCACVGALDLDPGFVDYLRDSARKAGIEDRLTFTGALTRTRLDAALAGAGLVVSASRRESYGMAVTEALARGVPVVVSEVGGLPEAVGHAPDGSRPGLLFPPDDPVALAAHLEQWLSNDELRERLRRSAAGRRTTLTTWDGTARQVAAVLAGSHVAR